MEKKAKSKTREPRPCLLAHPPNPPFQPTRDDAWLIFLAPLARAAERGRWAYTFINMKSNAKSESAITRIIIAVVIALLVGGSAPWWWAMLFPPQALSSECFPENIKAQSELLNMGDNIVSASVIKSIAKIMREQFRLQNFECVNNLAKVDCIIRENSGVLKHHKIQIIRITFKGECVNISIGILILNHT